jgi:hypothetical protein
LWTVVIFIRYVLQIQMSNILQWAVINE